MIKLLYLYPNTHLFHVDFKGTVGLTFRTGAWLNLLVLLLIKRPQDKSALEAIVLDHVELREDPSAGSHHPTSPDQLVQMQLSVKERAQSRKQYMHDYTVWASEHQQNLYVHVIQTQWFDVKEYHTWDKKGIGGREREKS